MSSESFYLASGATPAETFHTFEGLDRDDNGVQGFGLDGQGFLQLIALAGLVSGVVLGPLHNEGGMQVMGPGAARRPSPRRHCALSILDAPTTEKVIFEDAAPLINAFYRVQKRKERVLCSSVNI